MLLVEVGKLNLETDIEIYLSNDSCSKTNRKGLVFPLDDEMPDQWKEEIPLVTKRT